MSAVVIHDQVNLEAAGEIMIRFRNDGEALFALTSKHEAITLNVR